MNTKAITTRTQNKNLIKLMLTGLLLFLIISPSKPPSVAAQKEGNHPTLEAAFVWENALRMPGWSEVLVTLTNENNPWQGNLQIIDKTNEVTYQKPLQLPAHSQKQYRLPIFIPGSGRMEVALVNPEGTYISQEIRIKGIAERNRVCVVIDPLNDLRIDKTMDCYTTFLFQDLKELPETPMAWDTIDVLLLNGIATADITARQQEALLAWVGTGGRLIVGGGAALPQVLTGLPEVLIHTSLGTFDAQTGTMKLIPETGQEVVYDNRKNIILTSQRIGDGYVDIVSWDLAETRYRDYLPRRWENDTTPATMHINNDTTFPELLPPAYQLLQIPLSSTPGLWQWIVLFFLYILLIGPVTWLIVRKVQRPVLAWVLMPLWILIGVTGLSLWLNGSFAQTFPMVHEMALVYMPGPELPARTIQSMAIFAPHTKILTWEMEGSPRPLLGSYGFEGSAYGEGSPFPATVVWKDENLVRLQSKQPLGAITWGLEGLSTGAEISLTLALTTDEENTNFAGTLTSEVALENVRLLMNDVRYSVPLIDEVPAHVQTPIMQSVTRTQQTDPDYSTLCLPLGYERNDYYYYAPPYIPTTETLAETNRYDTNRCYLAATTPGAPFANSGAAGTHVSETCLLIAVPCPTAQRGAFSNLPASSWIERDEKGWVENDNTVYIVPPQTTVNYKLPDFLPPKAITAVNIQMQIPDWESSTALHEISLTELWNWQTENWVSQEIATDKQLRLVGRTAGQFFDPQEGLRMRLTPANSSGTLTIYITVTVDGTW